LEAAVRNFFEGSYWVAISQEYRVFALHFRQFGVGYAAST
jgi:hypothetical protein